MPSSKKKTAIPGNLSPDKKNPRAEARGDNKIGFQTETEIKPISVKSQAFNATFIKPVGRNVVAGKTFTLLDNGVLDTVAFGAGKHFTYHTRTAHDILSLFEVLTAEAATSKSILIRGELAEGLDPERRHPRQNIKTHDPGTRWLCIDIDKEPFPTDMIGKEAEVVRAWVKANLPGEFHDVDLIAQFSSSSFIDGKPPRLHLYFVLTKALNSPTIKGWLSVLKGRIDLSLFQQVQSHFIANPVFVGMVDPIERRWFIVNGTKPEVEVPVDIQVKASNVRAIEHIEFDPTSITLSPRSRFICEELAVDKPNAHGWVNFICLNDDHPVEHLAGHNVVSGVTHCFHDTCAGIYQPGAKGDLALKALGAPDDLTIPERVRNALASLEAQKVTLFKTPPAERTRHENQQLEMIEEAVAEETERLTRVSAQDELRDRFRWLLPHETYVDLTNLKTVSAKALDRQYAHVAFPSKTKITADGSVKMISASSYYDENRDDWGHPDLTGFTYAPGHADITTLNVRPAMRGRYLNTWENRRPVGRPGDITPFLTLAKFVLGEENVQFVLDRIALKLQQPDINITSALLLIGPQGSGKTMFATTVGRLIGSFTSTDAAALMGDFNAVLQAELIIIEEILQNSKWDQKALSNKLKPLVTADTVRINEKYEVVVTMVNRSYIIATSNYDAAMSLDLDDRRWFVVNGRERQDEKPAIIGAPYVQWLDSGGLEALAYHFSAEQYDTSHVDADAKPPETEAKINLIEATTSTPVALVAELIRDGIAPFAGGFYNHHIQVALDSIRNRLTNHTITKQHIQEALTLCGWINKGMVNSPTGFHTPLKKRIYVSPENANAKPIDMFTALFPEPLAPAKAPPSQPILAVVGGLQS